MNNVFWTQRENEVGNDSHLQPKRQQLCGICLMEKSFFHENAEVKWLMNGVSCWLCFRRVGRCGRTSVEVPTTAQASVQESTAASTSHTASLQPFKVKPNSSLMKLLLIKDCRSHAYWQQQFLHRMRDLHGHSDCVRWIHSIYPWYEVQDFLINVLQKFYVGPGQIQVRLNYDLEISFGLFWVWFMHRLDCTITALTTVLLRLRNSSNSDHSRKYTELLIEY